MASLTKEELAGNAFKTLFHPTTAKMLKMAQRKNKGANSVPLSLGEIMTFNLGSYYYKA